LLLWRSPIRVMMPYFTAWPMVALSWWTRFPRRIPMAWTHRLVDPHSKAARLVRDGR